MDSIRKITVAKCLDNVSTFLNEAFESSMGTQRAAMGDYKKFCLALTNVGVPQLIAFDLVAVSPMSSMYGNVAYIEYVKGTTKGVSEAGELTNGVYKLGEVDQTYTGDNVVETFVANQTKLGFAPVVEGAFKAADGKTALGDVAVTTGSTTVYGTFASEDARKTGTLASMTFKAADGTSTTHTFAADDKIAYKYDNIVIPQETLPTLKAELKNIGLEAHARRIAVFYSQMAAFQAKTDYGFDLADGLAEQAVGQLAYEIDTEIVEMLLNAAPGSTIADFSKTQPVGVSLADHYAAFAAKLEEYKMALYQKTKKFTPNFMVVASDVMPVLNFVPGFQPANVSDVNGPYFAGTLAGLKIFVTPNIGAGQFFLGVNQGAMQAAAGVYAPYMPVVPTQLLGFADGGMSQGWSTLYDAKILNADLLIKGAIVA